MPLFQQTLAGSVVIAGAGLHTGVRGRVTLRPAPPDHGRQIAAGPDEPARPMTWEHRVASVMSTSIALPDGRTARTIEHLSAALSAYGVDNVRVELDGPEVPILDGSARPWCRALERAGLRRQEAPRRVLVVRRPVQVRRHGGFLRIEPAGVLSADVTFDLIWALPAMRWAGRLDRDTFVAELAASRSFGQLDWRKLTGRPRGPRVMPRDRAAVEPHRPDPGFPDDTALDPVLDADKALADPTAPVLRGARPGRAALVLGGVVLPWRRYREEPVRHVVLDLLGDLALAGMPIQGRVVAHNPSHEKTYMLVRALVSHPDCWGLEEGQADTRFASAPDCANGSTTPRR